MLTSSLPPPLIIACDWIPPAFGAVGQYEMGRARGAALAGRMVTLIGLGAKAGDETVRLGTGSLRIIRIAAGAPDKASLLRRAAWALSMNVRLLDATRQAARAYGACEIKVTGSPPFFSYTALLWRQLFWRTSRSRIKLTYRITDFYPETAFAAGKARVLSPIAPLIHALRRSATRIEALSLCQKRRLIESGVRADHIEVVRDASPVVFSPDLRPALRPFNDETGPDGVVVLLYSGNLGIAHNWLSFAEGYRHHILHGSNRVRLWLNATGVGVTGLKAYCEAHALPVHASPPVPLDQLAGVLLAADAHLILLGDPFWGYVFPSKTYACLESGRPSLFVGPEQSDVHQLLQEDPRNISIRQGDARRVVDALERLSQLPDGPTVSKPTPQPN